MNLFSTSGQVNVAPQLKQVNTTAQKLYNQGAGFQTPPMADLYGPLSGNTQAAISGIANTAAQGNPLAGQSMGALSGILSPTGAMNQQYQNLFQNSGNQAYNAAVQNQSDLLANQVQQQFGGLGRLGSAADTGALTTQLGNFRSNALAQNWNQNVANQLGILGSQQSGQLNAVQAAPGAYGQQYLPYQMQAQAGAAIDAQNAAKRQAQLTRFNTQNTSQWGRLGAYQGLLAGNTQSLVNAGLVQPPSNPFGGLVGGALSGGQLGNMILPGYGGPIGSVIGGAVGYDANKNNYTL